MASVNSGFTPVSSNFPLSAISLMVSSSPFYDEAVNSMVAATNMVYREFLKSDEGQGFRGEVSPKKLYFYTSQRDTPFPFLRLLHERMVSFVVGLHSVSCRGIS